MEGQTGKYIQSLNVHFETDVPVRQIADSLGFVWRLTTDVVAVTNVSVNYEVNPPSPFRLGLSGFFSIPMLRLNSQASLLFVGSTSFSLSVRSIVLYMLCFWPLADSFATPQDAGVGPL